MSHSGSPRLTATGNPTFSNEVSQHIDRVVEATVKNKVFGSEPLLPLELLQVLNHQLHKNSLWEMQFAVIMVMLVFLYCRGNDLLGPQDDNPDDIKIGMQLSDIKLGHSHIGPTGKVEYIVLDVNGKTEKHSARLVLWRNRKTAVFCPVRFLLWWFAVSGVRDG